MESLFNPERIVGEKLTMVNGFHHHHDISNSCSSSGSVNEEEDGDDDEETSSCSPLQDMSSLLLQLPIKRGLSNNYNGKSQSFTSLSNVRCLEDLAKQENPFNKKLKTFKSYGGFSKKHASSSSSSPKKPSNRRSHCSSHLNGRRNFSFHNDDKNNSNNDRPPIHPPHILPSRLIY